MLHAQVTTVNRACAYGRCPRRLSTSAVVGRTVETMTKALAVQLCPQGTTVNAVAPGTTRTPANGAVFDVPGLAEQIRTTHFRLAFRLRGIRSRGPRGTPSAGRPDRALAAPKTRTVRSLRRSESRLIPFFTLGP
ncbi:SDR family oxidoreductase [Streptomyces globisporus]|uniref:SDR family oxidoreductase n=1 Tax=Streptomyces globisporus TaxID=1908 RepID=UPI0038140702